METTKLIAFVFEIGQLRYFLIYWSFWNMRKSEVDIVIVLIPRIRLDGLSFELKNFYFGNSEELCKNLSTPTVE